MTLGAFAVVILLRADRLEGEDISDYEGLAKAHPLTSALMLIFMFSLTGIPPTAGFVAKFYVFMAAIRAGYTPLAVVAVVFSVVSAFFYLRIVMYMYMREPKKTCRSPQTCRLAWRSLWPHWLSWLWVSSPRPGSITPRHRWPDSERQPESGFPKLSQSAPDRMSAGTRDAAFEAGGRCGTLDPQLQTGTISKKLTLRGCFSLPNYCALT